MMRCALYHADWDDMQICEGTVLAPFKVDFHKLDLTKYIHTADILVPDEYRRSGRCEYIFQLTNNIDHFWGDNPGVTLRVSLTNPAIRSTSVGDVYLFSDGECWGVQGVGHELLGRHVLDITHLFYRGEVVTVKPPAPRRRGRPPNKFNSVP